MRNVGDNVTFTLPGTTTDDIRYCWKWWDGSVDCTTVNTIQKTLNMGGNPLDSFVVRYAVEPVDVNGNFADYNGTLAVNNPPTIVIGSASLTQNGQEVNFPTTASVTVYDLEGDLLSFQWTDNGVFVSTGTQIPVGLIAGTYAGTYAGQFWGTRASLDFVVENSTTLGLTITDANGGVTAIDFPLYGFKRVGQTFSPVSGPVSQLGSTTNLYTVVLGQPAVFSVFALTADYATRFSWGFWGTNGWANPTSSNGVTTSFPDGSIQNTVTVSTVGEQPGQKKAEVFIYDLLHTTLTQLLIPVDLVLNSPPTIERVTLTPEVPAHGDWVQCVVDYVDQSENICTVAWDFTTTSLTLEETTTTTTGTSTGTLVFNGLGTVVVTTVTVRTTTVTGTTTSETDTTLYGRTVWLNSGPGAAGSTISGNCTVIDRFGASTSLPFSVVLS